MTKRGARSSARRKARMSSNIVCPRMSDSRHLFCLSFGPPSLHSYYQISLRGGSPKTRPKYPKSLQHLRWTVVGLIRLRCALLEFHSFSGFLRPPDSVVARLSLCSLCSHPARLYPAEQSAGIQNVTPKRHVRCRSSCTCVTHLYFELCQVD